MKYLVSIEQDRLQEIEDRFRAGGIPIYIEADEVKSNEAAIVPAAIVSRFNLPASWHRINVCLDEQFEEAKRLLADPTYSVMTPVDVEEFDRTMQKLGAGRVAPIPESVLNWTIGGFLAVVAAVLALIAIVK